MLIKQAKEKQGHHRGPIPKRYGHQGPIYSGRLDIPVAGPSHSMPVPSGIGRRGQSSQSISDSRHPKERHEQGTMPWSVRPTPKETASLHARAKERFRTVFFLGGSRVRRLATHAKKVFHSPINLTSNKAYEVAELGTIGLVPDRMTVKHWLPRTSRRRTSLYWTPSAWLPSGRACLEGCTA